MDEERKQDLVFMSVAYARRFLNERELTESEKAIEIYVTQRVDISNQEKALDIIADMEALYKELIDNVEVENNDKFRRTLN